MTQPSPAGDWIDTLKRQASESERRWGVAMSLSVGLGLFGVDRFYLGYGLLGWLKLLTLGGFGWWWVADVCWLLIGRMKDADGRVLRGPFG